MKYFSIRAATQTSAFSVLIGALLIATFATPVYAESKAQEPSLIPVATPQANVATTAPSTLVQPPPTFTPLEAVTPEMRADIFMARQQYQAAIATLVAIPSPTAVTWNKIGIAYQHLSALEEAQADYQRAVKMNPDYADALNNLATIYYAKKDYRKAQKLYRQAIQLMPNSAIVLSNLGAAYFAQLKFKQGAEAYRAAFAIDPQFPGQSQTQPIPESSTPEERARRNYCLAQLYAQAGMQDRALQYLRRAMDNGFNDRKRLMEDQEFAVLRSTAEFTQLLTEQKKH